MRQVYILETNESEPLMNASRASPDLKTMSLRKSWDKSDGDLFTGQMASGVKVA